MKKALLTLTILLALTLSGCLFNSDCCECRSSHEVAPGLYVERYTTFCAGVFGEANTSYLTDSSTFRQKVGWDDEHSFLIEQIDGDDFTTYTIESRDSEYIAARKFFTSAQLAAYHHTAATCLGTIPLFGINPIACDTDFYNFSSYETFKGHYLTDVQYKCGSEYRNAMFFTDSSKFCILVKVENVGERGNLYRVENKGDTLFEFQEVTSISWPDTIRSETFRISELRKKGFAKVCE